MTRLPSPTEARSPAPGGHSLVQQFMGLGCECGRFDARYDEICGGVCPWLDGGGATARRASPGARPR
ncbi:MAG: hypothetical protein JNM69_13620 [Archangium sp.]|nr:hypothetical protein [Archangium sp.]